MPVSTDCLPADRPTPLPTDPKEHLMALFCENVAERGKGVCSESQTTPFQNVRSNVVASMKTIFPNLSASSKESESLVNIVTKTVRKVSSDDETKERHNAVLIICNTLIDLFPRRAMFSLLQRWSRKKKNHFLKDAINVVTVLTCNNGELRIDEFLDNARTWKVSPPSISEIGCRKSFIISYVPTDNHERKYEFLALKLDVSFKLMNSTMAGIQDIIFSRFRRSSVNQHDQFKLGDKIAQTAADDDHQDLDDIDGNDEFVFESSPIQGFHMPTSFRARVWRSVEHIHFGRVLVRILFGGVILKRKMYPGVHNLNEKFLMFLFTMTADCTTRPMYVSALAKLCIYTKDRRYPRKIRVYRQLCGETRR